GSIAHLFAALSGGLDGGSSAGPDAFDRRLAGSKLGKPAGAVGPAGIPLRRRDVLVVAGALEPALPAVATSGDGSFCAVVLCAAGLPVVAAAGIPSGLSSVLSSLGPAVRALDGREGTRDERYALGDRVVRQTPER